MVPSRPRRSGRLAGPRRQPPHFRAERLPTLPVLSALRPPAGEEVLDGVRRVEMFAAVADGLAYEPGTPLGLLDDLDQVLTEDGDGQEVDATEEEHENDDRRQTERKRGVTDLVHDLVDARRQRQRRER